MSELLMPTEPQILPSSQAPIRVLIVEDERIIAYDLRLRLQHLGYWVVDVVSSGEEAIKVVREQNLDVVLMDVVIDGEIDGIDAAKVIRTINPLPIIFLTAFSDDITFERARQIEQFAYILKPFQERELHITIKTVLQQFKLEQKVRQSEQQYRSLFEHTIEPILILDDEGNIQDLNLAAKKLLGPINREKRTLFNLFPPKGQAYIRHKFERLLETGSASGKFKLTFRSKEKTHLFLELRLQANLYLGLHIAMLNNATARVESERTIKELARITSDSPHPIIRLSLKGEVLFFNKAALPFVFHWGDNYHDEIPPRLLDLMRATAEGKQVSKLIYRLKRKVYSIRLVYVPEGRYVNFYATDISNLHYSQSLVSVQLNLLEQIAKGRPISILARHLVELLYKASPTALVGFVNVNAVSGKLTPVRRNNPDVLFIISLLISKFKSGKVLQELFRASQKPVILSENDAAELFSESASSQTTPIRKGFAIQPIIGSSGQLVMVLVVNWYSSAKKRNEPMAGLMRMASNVMSVAIERDKNVRTLSNQALLFGSINDSVIILDASGRITDWNLSSHKLFGFMRENALSKTLEELNILPKGPSTSQLKDTIIPLFQEVEFKDKAGRQGFAELSLVPMADEHNEPLGCMCLFRDITIRKQYEDQIRTSEANLAALIENTDDLICSVNIHGDLLTTNSAFQKFISRLSDENSVSSSNLLVVLPPRIAAELDSYVRRALKGQKLLQEFVLTVDGADMVLETSFNPMRDENGKIEGASIFARNITNRKQAEDELLRTNFELDSFVYRASHDLRAPMRSILGLLNLMEIDKAEDSRMNYIGLVRTSINKLDNFIADLTHYSRNSRTIIDPETVDFLQIVDECLENLKYMEHAGRVNIFTDIYGNSAFYSDNSRLSVVFQNLISNAIKYQDLEKTDPFLKIRVSSGFRNAQILIEDNGKGIDQNYLNRIFDMFFRASDESYGSGLGLYITKQVIEKLGGTIAVNSEIWVGTTFAITIPNLNPANEIGPDERKSQQNNVKQLK